MGAGSACVGADAHVTSRSVSSGLTWSRAVPSSAGPARGPPLTQRKGWTVCPWAQEACGAPGAGGPGQARAVPAVPASGLFCAVSAGYGRGAAHTAQGMAGPGSRGALLRDPGALSVSVLSGHACLEAPLPGFGCPSPSLEPPGTQHRCYPARLRSGSGSGSRGAAGHFLFPSPVVVPLGTLEAGSEDRRWRGAKCPLMAGAGGGLRDLGLGQPALLASRRFPGGWERGYV